MPVTETDKLDKSNGGSSPNGGTTESANARAIIFDRRWDFALDDARGDAGSRGHVELRVLELPQSQQCELCVSVGIAGSIPLQYNVDVNGDTYREFALPSDVRLAIDVANVRMSRRQASFDLLIELRPSAAAGANLRIFHDTVLCSVPTKTMVEEQQRTQLPNVAQLERALASLRAMSTTGN
jgi:hypothetical protein